MLLINPRHILPIPLHTTRVINHSYLRLAVEMLTVRRSATDGIAAGQRAGAEAALELVRLLYEKVRVRPTPFHGGLFIGRACHPIGDHSSLVCTSLMGTMSQAHLSAFELAWTL